MQSAEDSCHKQIGLKFKEYARKILHLELAFLWCWNLDTSKSKSEISWKFWNVMLEKDGEDKWIGRMKNEEALRRVK